MEEREIQSKKRYILAFAIGTAIFLFIFMVSYSFSYFEFQRISSLQGETAYEIFKDKLDNSLFSQENCSQEIYFKVSEDLGFQGQIINDLEKKLGKNNQEVLFQKKFYSMIELEHFEFVKEMNKKCDQNIQIIFFFYSNEKSEEDYSEDLGRLLDKVVERNPNLVIYSFDTNLDADLIKKLKKKYNVEEPNTLILNEEEKLVNPKGFLEIEEKLN